MANKSRGKVRKAHPGARLIGKMNRWLVSDDGTVVIGFEFSSI